MKVLFDMDGTIAKFYEKRETCLEEMYDEGFFKYLSPYGNVLMGLKMLIEKKVKGLEVGIISACVTEQCKEDKRFWLHYYLPEIKPENIVLCDVGLNKAEVYKELGGDVSQAILVDDYTRNLMEWLHGGGAAGVKLRNELNGTKGTWKEYSIDYRDTPEEICAELINIASIHMA